MAEEPQQENQQENQQDNQRDNQSGGDPGFRGQYGTGHSYRSCPCKGVDHTCGA